MPQAGSRSGPSFGSLSRKGYEPSGNWDRNRPAAERTIRSISARSSRLARHVEVGAWRRGGGDSATAPSPGTGAPARVTWEPGRVRPRRLLDDMAQAAIDPEEASRRRVTKPPDER